MIRQQLDTLVEEYEEELKLIEMNINISRSNGGMGNSIQKQNLIHYKAKKEQLENVIKDLKNILIYC